MKHFGSWRIAHRVAYAQACHTGRRFRVRAVYPYSWPWKFLRRWEVAEVGE